MEAVAEETRSNIVQFLWPTQLRCLYVASQGIATSPDWRRMRLTESRRRVWILFWRCVDPMNTKDIQGVRIAIIIFRRRLNADEEMAILLYKACKAVAERCGHVSSVQEALSLVYSALARCIIRATRLGGACWANMEFNHQRLPEALAPSTPPRASSPQAAASQRMSLMLRWADQLKRTDLRRVLDDLLFASQLEMSSFQWARQREIVPFHEP